MYFKIGIGIFLALTIIYLIYAVLIKNTFVINKRLDNVRADGSLTSKEDKDMIRGYIESGKLYRIPLLGKFYEKQIESLNGTNIPMTSKEYFISSIGVFTVFLLIGTSVTGRFTIGLVLGVIAMLIPNFYVNYLKNKRSTNLNEQLPEFLNTLSNALRSGLSLQQGISIAIEEAKDPVKWEFGKVLSDMKMGRTTESALENLKSRSQNENIDLLVNAINIQMSVGGNLSEILDLLAETIRANAKLQRYFKSTIAQNKLSGIVIGLLPIGLAGVLTLINPEYMTPLFTDSLGRMMLIGAVVMMGLGIFIIKKITELEV